MEKSHLEEVAAFIREHRSNESNYEKLKQKLEEEVEAGDEDYTTQLTEIKEKHAEEYIKAKDNGGTAWPEFEKFISAFEKTVIEAMQKAV
jgi:hypothetical protein